MARRVVGMGTVLNAAAVVVGSLVGMFAKGILPDRVPIVYGIGLIAALLGVQMFLKTRNPLVVLAAICAGGALGSALGLDRGLAALADSTKGLVGGGSNFSEGFITASVLFCVGPMTLMGCLQDALDEKIELLAVKSLLDGISSVFLAAVFGVAILGSALMVLVIQGFITFLAKPLAPFAKNPILIDQTVATGGVIMVAIGLSICEIKPFSSVLFLPALILAPMVAQAGEKFLPQSKADTS